MPTGLEYKRRLKNMFRDICGKEAVPIKRTLWRAIELNDEWLTDGGPSFPPAGDVAADLNLNDFFSFALTGDWPVGV
ncbi:hypothetical protein [Absidia glauca]|uniref:Uncharacterized protein n=1 Tax=Absidia glauca TaxID=4829 RepID=A0A163J0E8_ABSGL|nr:hypothetical protein [Absidia glauca]